jgi:hypothetical protein
MMGEVTARPHHAELQQAILNFSISSSQRAPAHYAASFARISFNALFLGPVPPCEFRIAP